MSQRKGDAHGFVCSRSMRFNNRSCEDNSAIHFSCIFTFRSKARIAGAPAGAARCMETAASGAVGGLCDAGSPTVSAGEQGGTAAHPPLRPSKPETINAEPHCHLIVCTLLCLRGFCGLPIKHSMRSMLSWLCPAACVRNAVSHDDPHHLRYKGVGHSRTP